MIDEQWLQAVLANRASPADKTGSVERLRHFLLGWAEGFAQHRDDVQSARLTWPQRGLLPDESASFLRAVDEGLASVNDAGYVSLPTLRPKNPQGRYAPFSKSGQGVALNLEYLIQVGAAAELVLDHGWPPDAVDFERGEFDALGLDDDGQVRLAMEAKARVTGTDSLESMLRFLFRALRDPTVDHRNNSGRKLLELQRLTATRPVVVWLVADGARWTLLARAVDGALCLWPGPAPARTRVTTATAQEDRGHAALPFDARHHRPGSVAALGRCSQHGLNSCMEPPVISFQDRHSRWQSGCARAARELVARGEIAPTLRP